MSKTTVDSLRDQIYRAKQPKVDRFEFNSQVVSVFPDMIRRSIPGYDTIIHLSGVLAAQYLTPGSRCYDLGCSLGATTASVLDSIGEMPVNIESVDASGPMIEEASNRITDSRVHFQQADIRKVSFRPASVVILNFVLQFLPPEDRFTLLNTVRNTMNPDGLLIISEKVEFTEEFDEIHTEFKRSNSYSDLEIAQKRQALERVMQIDSEHTHLNRLYEAGFRRPRRWFQCLNWVSFIANA
ncbi:MAG: carboxy-S-adenosyl-L-methionine synthase CmoA [Gammaproteobacteria bacterium]|nr:carboxy-S-adenosyl-L-methionine synthase CmoA [Gammaproteobacteria bacterium]MYD79626.1 carboxy-S-adenosyl-L-methionine synthase CmoA [Gammaproteobacteria bacterium]